MYSRNGSGGLFSSAGVFSSRRCNSSIREGGGKIRQRSEGVGLDPGSKQVSGSDYAYVTPAISSASEVTGVTGVISRLNLTLNSKGASRDTIAIGSCTL